MNKILKKLTVLFVFLFIFLIPERILLADENKTVDYGGEVIIDSDLDGLTDKGEEQIYKTNPSLPDTDGDGFYDGTEIINGTNPLDHNSPLTSQAGATYGKGAAKTPWAWYISRASGLLAFLFLWLAVFLGLSIRNLFIKKFIEPIYSFDLHCFIAALAVFWGLVHGTSFLLHGDFALTLKEVFVPFYSKTILVDPFYMGLGIIAFYAMAVMTVTSYLRSRLSHFLWRVIHFLNPLAFIFIIFHGIKNGTDTNGNIYVGILYLASSLFLILIYSSTLFSVIWDKIMRQKV
jgi:hypothetical protein